MTNKSNVVVSVIVPTYNRESLVLDALESVKSQSYRPIQLVIVDDGSSDSTVQVVDTWRLDNEESDFKIDVTTQPNSGGNVARNKGISLTTGKLISFLDSDDVWHPHKIELQVAEILKDEKIGAVYCGLQHVVLPSNQVTSKQKHDYPTGRLLAKILICDVTNPTSTYMVRRAVFEKVGVFDETLEARQDWDMWIRIASKFHISCVPEILVDFRDHDGPRTISNPQREITAYSKILTKYENLYRELTWVQRRMAYAAYFRRMGRVYFHKNISWFKAVGFSIRSILNWPFAFDSWAAFVGMFLPTNFRQQLHRCWNLIFGKTWFAIRSH